MSASCDSFLNAAEDYFSSISSLARRIMEERLMVKEEYDEEWDFMSYDEQEDAIYDYFVSPKLQEKFSSTLKLGGEAESFPKLMVKPGNKIIVDEDGCNSWRDEHSAPFCWETQSQLGFTYIENPHERDSIIEDRRVRRKLIQQRLRGRNDRKEVIEATIENDKKEYPEVSQDIVGPSSPPEEEAVVVTPSLSELRNAVKTDVEAVLQNKLKNIELNAKEDFIKESSIGSVDENIPKSGFDFLDEW